MDLEELRSVQNAERRKGDLQPLRESFYEEAGDYIADLKRERDSAAADADDPWSDPQVSRLSDEIETAEEVLEAIYDRRMGKLLTRASLAAAEMNASDDGLTAEEQALFHDLVDRIADNKSHVLNTLAGKGTDGRGERRPDPTPRSGSASAGSRNATRDAESTETGTGLEEPGVSVADAMGDQSEPVETATGDREPPPDRPTDPGRESGDDTVVNPERQTPDPAHGTSPPEQGGPDSERSDRRRGDPSTDGGPAGGGRDTHRVTVRVLRDVGSILGVDDREYELSSEDVVQLPEQNAEPLVKRDAVERLD